MLRHVLQASQSVKGMFEDWVKTIEVAASGLWCDEQVPATINAKCVL